MKLATWKRMMLAGLLTLSVTVPSLTTFSAAHAASGGGLPTCPYSSPDCGSSAR
jgi:hypothetical protein